MDYCNPLGAVDATDEIDEMFDAALLVNINTGNILYSKNENDTFTPVGSAVNLMSAYVTAFETNLEQEIVITDDVENVDSNARVIGLEVGQRWLVGDLVAAMMLHSAQDAALALSAYISEGEDAYLALMNDAAVRLGMSQTLYTNVSGMSDAEQTTTVYDLALLCEAALNNDGLAPIITAGSYEVGTGEVVESRLNLMKPDQAVYDEKVKGIGAGSVTGNTNIMLHLVENGNEYLFIGFSADSSLDDCETNAKLIYDYYINAYTTVDVSNIVRTMLLEQTITLASGEIVTPAMQDTVCLISVEKVMAATSEYTADFSLGSLPDISVVPNPGDQIGSVVLLYQDQEIVYIPLVANSVQYRNGSMATQPPTTNISGEDDIPFYTLEDWEALKPEPSFIDQNGFYVTTVAVIALAALALVLSRMLRRRHH